VIWVAIGVAILAALGAVYALWDNSRVVNPPEQRFAQAVRKHVIVHLREGVSLDGVLAGLYADGVQLDAVTFLRADDHDTPLEGSQLLPWSNILWVQELTDAGPSAENT
jgi:hypothetical protein